MSKTKMVEVDIHGEPMDDQTRWWHNLPQCKVGDLVIFKRRKAAKAVGLMLVVEVYPEKPCRAHPCQNVICVNDDGDEGTFGADKLEVISGC